MPKPSSGTNDLIPHGLRISRNVEQNVFDCGGIVCNKHLQHLRALFTKALRLRQANFQHQEFNIWVLHLNNNY